MDLEDAAGLGVLGVLAESRDHIYVVGGDQQLNTKILES